MQEILDGAVKFMEEDFLEHKELFESLGEKQTPHTLFVGCIDSRAKYRKYRASVPQKRGVFGYDVGDRVRLAIAKRAKRHHLRAQ